MPSKKHPKAGAPWVRALRSAPAESQSQSHISWREGDVGASALWQNYCSFHLSIFIIAQFPTAASLPRPWFMARSPSASSQGRHVHHRDFSPGSLLFIPKSRRGEEEEQGWQTRGGDRWKQGELTEGSEADWTEREKEAVIHLSIHQRGDTALQIC